IPMLIVCVAVGLYVGIRFLVGGGPESASDFVALLQSNTINRRWQAAYEIANRLSGPEIPPEFADPQLVAALGTALKQARSEKEEPPKSAVLILRILGRLQDPASLPAVREALDDEHDWVRSYAMLALGSMKDRESVPRIRGFLDHDDHGTRQAALAALAELDQVEGLGYRLTSETKAGARARLGDLHEDVRFTAALILARTGEREGVLDILLRMMDRDHLKQLTPDARLDTRLGGIDRARLRSRVVLQSIQAVEALKAGDDERVVAQLRKLTGDGDPDVRERARVALVKLNKKP
ncbi:MAG: HEAT repeat domain-containing protein, partial [Planctomycetota bacterium]|nr:HEAT repeat domain-containing protein [Planctomycetota bacterium]